MLEKYLNLLPEKLVIEGGFFTLRIELDSQYLSIEPSLKVFNHSPTGFNWGYCGSGPAQLALAILLKYLPKEIAVQHYQDFKFGFIAGLPRTDFIKTINLRQIMTEILESKNKINNHD